MSTNLTDAHIQWRNRPQDQRFETLADLRESVNNRRMRSRSIDIDASQVKVSIEDEQLIVNSAIAPCRPSHWSFGQLATSIKAPAAYLRNLPLPLVADCLNYGLKNAERDTVKFMTVSGDENNTLQAVTSSTYGRIWDADAVDAVRRIVERTNGKFYNPKARTSQGERPSGLYASDHDVFMFMIDGGSLLDVGARAKLNRGFIVWNSETGAKTFGLMTFLFNVVCGNHIIWGAQDVNKLVIRHTPAGPYRFDSQAAPALRAYADASAKPIEDAVRKATEMLLPEGFDQLLAWASKHGKFTKNEVKEAIAFAKSEEGDCRTLWQLVQGGTAYARGFDHIDARVDLETRFGKLLDIVAA